MGSRDQQDRRQAARIPKAAFTAITTSGPRANNQAFGLITDVSARGICVRTPQPPATEEK